LIAFVLQADMHWHYGIFYIVVFVCDTCRWLPLVCSLQTNSVFVRRDVVRAKGKHFQHREVRL